MANNLSDYNRRERNGNQGGYGSGYRDRDTSRDRRGYRKSFFGRRKDMLEDSSEAAREKRRRPRIYFHQSVTKIKLPKLLTKACYLSPNLARQFVESGRVRINSRVVSSAMYEVNLRRERVTIDETPIEYPRWLRYMVYHKPEGVVCDISDPVFSELFDEKLQWCFPFGQLSRSVSGLVVMCNDPRMLRMQHFADSELQKEYRIKINGHLTDDNIRRLVQGLQIDEDYFVPLELSIFRSNSDTMWIDITVLDDSYKTVVLALKELGFEVLKARRTRIALLTEEMVPQGEWRELLNLETTALKLERFMRGELPPEPIFIIPEREKPWLRKKPWQQRGKEEREGGRRGNAPRDRRDRDTSSGEKWDEKGKNEKKWQGEKGEGKKQQKEVRATSHQDSKPGKEKRNRESERGTRSDSEGKKRGENEVRKGKRTESIKKEPIEKRAEVRTARSANEQARGGAAGNYSSRNDNRSGTDRRQPNNQRKNEGQRPGLHAPKKNERYGAEEFSMTHHSDALQGPGLGQHLGGKEKRETEGQGERLERKKTKVGYRSRGERGRSRGE